MKNTKKLICFAFSAILLFSSTLTSVATSAQTNEFEYLKTAIATIDAVPTDEINQFIEDNQEWIDSVGLSLENYLATIPETQQKNTITRLLGGNPLARSGNLGEYFDYTMYHLRNGYWTYSMYPKLSVRLWRPTMQAAWAALGNRYPGIANDNGSLWNQYECHWTYDPALLFGDWDLEVGRPIVSGLEMIRTFCNP